MHWNMFKVKEQKQRNRCEGRKSNSQGQKLWYPKLHPSESQRVKNCDRV